MGSIYIRRAAAVLLRAVGHEVMSSGGLARREAWCAQTRP